jgi:hypothetical protein
MLKCCYGLWRRGFIFVLPMPLPKNYEKGSKVKTLYADIIHRTLVIAFSFMKGG